MCLHSLMLCTQVSTILGSVLSEQRKAGEWIEGVAIWVAVLIVIAVGASEQRASRMSRLQPVVQHVPPCTCSDVRRCVAGGKPRIHQLCASRPRSLQSEPSAGMHAGEVDVSPSSGCLLIQHLVVVVSCASARASRMRLRPYASHTPQVLEMITRRIVSSGN